MACIVGPVPQTGAYLICISGTSENRMSLLSLLSSGPHAHPHPKQIG